jgi:hypothetical protein
MRLGRWYARALLLAIWSGVCMLIGAGWLYIALLGVLRARGVL